MCLVAFIEAHLSSSGLFVPQREVLVKRLGSSVRLGTDPSSVVTFLLEKYGIPWYCEADCSMERLSKMLSQLPPNVDIIASVWDARYRPGYSSRKDKPDSHVVALLREEQNGVDEPIIHFYDFDTIIGGVKTWPREMFRLWWHDGHGAVSGKNRRIEIGGIDKMCNQSLMIFGMKDEEIWDLVGRPG